MNSYRYGQDILYTYYEVMFTLICILPGARYSHTFFRTWKNELFMHYAKLNPDGSQTDEMVIMSDSEDYKSFFRSPAGIVAKKLMSDYNAGRLKSDTIYLNLTDHLN